MAVQATARVAPRLAMAVDVTVYMGDTADPDAAIDRAVDDAAA